MSLDLRADFLENLISQQKASFDPSCANAHFIQKAMDHFLEIGLPDRNHKDYAYFPLAKLYEKKEPVENVVKTSTESLKDKVLPECLNSFLVIKDGVIDFELSNLSALPKQVVIDPLESSTSPYLPFVHAKLVQNQKKQLDPFALFCQARLQGLLLIIPENLQLDVPLQIHFLSEKPGALATFNSYIHIGKQARAKLIFTHLSSQDSPMTSYSDIDVEDEGVLELVRLPSESATVRIESMAIHLKKAALSTVIDLEEPKRASKFHLHVTHEKKGASSKLYSLSVAKAKTEYHLSSVFEHLVKETFSHQHVKTVLASKAKASFDGQIYVHPEALLTQSYQKHDTLMLGEHGMIASRPNLKILADDVKASHGATIAELDKDALFYLKTRGISEEVAKKLLLEAFCQEILDHLNLESLKEIGGLLAYQGQDYDDHYLS
jgi:Fe-S cluster assembly protein SufD